MKVKKQKLTSLKALLLFLLVGVIVSFYLQMMGLKVISVAMREEFIQDIITLPDLHQKEDTSSLYQEKGRYNFTVAACVCVKDAEAYFEEWIDYHVGVINFDQVYIFDHSRDFELQRWYVNSRNDSIFSRAEVIHLKDTGEKYNEEKGEYTQHAAYSNCVEQFGKNGPRHDYIAFIDIDEFIVLKKKKYTDIHAVLEKYLVPYGGALTVNWMMIGTANKTVYSPVPVTKRFQYRDSKPLNIIKSIVKSSDYKNHVNPHAVRVTQNKEIHTTKYPGAILKVTGTGASDKDRPSNVFLLYHYRYTSLKEYIFKRCIRGNLGVGDWCKENGYSLRNNSPSHIQPSPGSVYDDTIWQLLIATFPKYRIYDQLWKDFS